MTLHDELQTACRAIRERIGDLAPRVGFVLGSGLGAWAETLEDAVRIPYGEIPGFPVSGVVGHDGALVVGRKDGLPVAALSGRVHYYEGHSMAKVTFAPRTLARLGCRTFVITNAAGGVNAELSPGDLLLIRDHLNLMHDNPLRGENDERLGPRFPDMTCAYPEELRELARRAGSKAGVSLREGVYAAAMGPSYETPAEVRMLGILGADVVGMSTVPEVIALNHMGARVLGISCVTNLAAGISGHTLSHDEVTETAARVRGLFTALLDAICAELAREAA